MLPTWKVLTPLAAMALVACAATGVKVTDEQLAGLVAGVATEADVIQRLGAPTTRLRQGDGTVMLQYVYAEAQVRAASFVPVVGMFAGGSDVRSNLVMLTFGPDGKLRTTMSSASQYGTGTGASAGNISPAGNQQPRQ